MPEPLLSLHDLCIERGERLLLNGLDFCLNPGDIVQIHGPNGAGKTSLMRVIAGLLDATEGQFHWRGQTVSNPKRFSDEILYLGHKSAVRYPLTALENLQWYAALQPQQVKASGGNELRQVLKDIGLAGYEDELCANLSAGQKRRVGLARMAISSAPLWVLDEPFTAVDVSGVTTLLNWIENYVSQGGAVLYTTHQAVAFQHHQPRILDLAAR